MESWEEYLERRKKVYRTNIVYFNDKDEVVEKKDATKLIITEYDKDGNILNEVFGTCKHKNKNEEER